MQSFLKISLFVGFFYSFALPVFAQNKFNNTDSIAYNTALIGTYIYQAPALDAPKVVLVDYGESVQLLQTNINPQPLLHKGVQSRWHKVKAGDQEGYILDTDLTSLDVRDRSILRNSDYYWYFLENHKLDTSTHYDVNCLTGKPEEKGECYGQYLLTKDSIEVTKYFFKGQQIFEMTLPNFSIEKFFSAVHAIEPHITWCSLQDPSGTQYIKIPKTDSDEAEGFTFIYHRDTITQYITHLAVLPFSTNIEEPHFELRIKYIAPNKIKVLIKTETVERIAQQVKVKKH